MKLLNKSFEKDDSGEATLICEESEDLWHLYNLVVKGDRIKASTIRKIQRESATGTTTSETKKIWLTIDIKSVEYDAQGDLIRFSGRNCEENQWVKMGAHHTIEVELNNKVTVKKDNWDYIFRQQLEEATDIHKSAEVAVVLLDAGVANYHLLTAVLAKDVHRVTVQMPKKRLTTTGYDKALVRFFEQVYTGIKDHIDLNIVKCVVLAGPGFVKDDFNTWMQKRAVDGGDSQIVQKKSVFIPVHSSCVHKQALKELLVDDGVQKMIANTKAALHLKALEDFYNMLKTDPDRCAYGPLQVRTSVELGAVQTLMVTDSLFRNASVQLRRQYVEMTETCKEAGTKVYVFSQQHVTGEQLAQLSGIAAVLRFPVQEIDDIDSDAELEVDQSDMMRAKSGPDEEDDDPFSF